MKKILKKIVKAWRDFANRLGSFGADRYLHLLAGLLAAFIVGCVASGSPWSAGLLGLIAAFAIGFFKEIFDAFTGEGGDLTDLLFTTLGGAVGYGLILLAAA